MMEKHRRHEPLQVKPQTDQSHEKNVEWTVPLGWRIDPKENIFESSAPLPDPLGTHIRTLESQAGFPCALRGSKHERIVRHASAVVKPRTQAPCALIDQQILFNMGLVKCKSHCARVPIRGQILEIGAQEMSVCVGVGPTIGAEEAFEGQQSRPNPLKSTRHTSSNPL